MSECSLVGTDKLKKEKKDSTSRRLFFKSVFHLPAAGGLRIVNASLLSDTENICLKSPQQKKDESRCFHTGHVPAQNQTAI